MPTLRFIPSYLYEEYADDENVQAFVSAFNDMAQEYLDWFNVVGLPIYSGLSGGLLDWVGLGLYGVPRPVLPFGVSTNDGLYGDLMYGAMAYGDTSISSSGSFVTDDDTYKRCLTWQLYKGDGKQFTISWLKKRVMRFLNGIDGASLLVDQTYDVSVMFPSGDGVDIFVPSTYDKASILQAAIASGALPLPFQRSFTVTIV